MNYEEAKKKLKELEWMKAWANATRSRTIELDWDLPRLNIIIRIDGESKIVPLPRLVDVYLNHLFQEGLQ
tara:strand:+ start:223 stop:432 length:210 start_codon:yes stop_codon:yes gene_type:complete